MFFRILEQRLGELICSAYGVVRDTWNMSLHEKLQSEFKISEILQFCLFISQKAILISRKVEGQLSKAEVGLFLSGAFLLCCLSGLPMALPALWASGNVHALLTQFSDKNALSSQSIKTKPPFCFVFLSDCLCDIHLPGCDIKCCIQVLERGG